MAAKVDLLSLTAVELQGLLNSNAITSVDITKRFLDQIEKHNHAGLHLNAVISTAPTHQVLQHARQLDEERQRGAIRGPLHGVPVIVKDAYSTPGLGMPTTCGSFAFSKATAKANARIIDKLVAAGMIIIAKANMSELGNMKGYDIMAGWSAFGGQTQTPYVKGGIMPNATWLSHSGPAGSSSGSAAGVAAGFAPLSLGTESDGSIMMPASRAGLYALKLTPGSVDDTGVQPALRSFDSLGAFSKSVTDLAQLIATMQEREVESYFPLPSSWKGLKVGFVDPRKWRSYPAALEPTPGFWEQMDEALFAAQEKIRKLGGKVVESVPLIAFDNITAAMPDMDQMEDLYPYELRKTLPEWLSMFVDAPQTIEELIEFNKAHAQSEFTQRNDNQKLLEAARDCTTTKEEFDRSMKALRDTASGNVRSLLKDHDIDVILGPCDSRTASVGSASGFPVANLPLGFAKFNGRAFALHMIAPAGEEAKLLQVMAAWEATFPENVRPPPLLTET